MSDLTSEERQELRKAAEPKPVLPPTLDEAIALVEKFACGDNSCLFTDKRKRGMSTNGGCRCGERGIMQSALACLYKAAKRQAEDVAARRLRLKRCVAYCQCDECCSDGGPGRG